jgi:hypothetical protein
MKLKIKYISIDPYYSDFEQTFIGLDINSCYDQCYEFENYLGREHSNGISSIYKTEVVYDESMSSFYNANQQ